MSDSQSDFLVIGSGPAAIAATHALASLGHHVVVLDVGNTLEDEKEEVVSRMSKLEPNQWTQSDINHVVGARKTTKDVVNSKLSYGSDYVFGKPQKAVDIRWPSNTGFHHSLSLGGLSNVWGASLLSYRQEDIESWPVSIEEMAPHYEAVMRFVPSTAINDDLEEFLPSYSTQDNSLEPSDQGKKLLNDLVKNKASLREAGIYFGRARLAINAKGVSTSGPCRYCALCLSGCPYGLIYSASDTVQELSSSGKITYLSDHLVETYEESDELVKVKGTNLKTKEAFCYTTKRLFLGAGVLPTATIVLKSKEAYNRTVRLRDSQYFIYPLFRFKKSEDVETEKTYTLSQAFLEISDSLVNSKTVHLQLYGYSRFLHGELERTFLKWPLRFKWFRNFFLGRLMIAQGYLHSDESGHIDMALKKDSMGVSYLAAEIHHSKLVFKKVLKVGWKLTKQLFKLRAIPLFPGLKITDPGSGYHCGGSFPMTASPDDLETDKLGRFKGSSRVHLIDASVLPSIPATSITMSSMANAHRIATSASSLEE